MYELLIGIAIAGALALGIFIPSYFLLRKSGDRLDASIASGKAREKELVESLDLVTADRDAAREAERILHDNQRELLTEIAEHKLSNQTLAARLVASEKAFDDLVANLKNNPGALPAAVHGAIERLRAQVSAARQAAATAAGRDSGGGEEGAVHAAGADVAPG